LINRVKLQGFYRLDNAAHRTAANRDLEVVREGQLKYRESVVEGCAIAQRLSSAADARISANS
jgi:NADPH-dependent curcumin reductase CurA